MKLYLMRHAHAEDGSPEDADRGLTEKGHGQVETMAAFMEKQIGRVDVVITSPFRRAVQTAGAMSRALHCGLLLKTPALQPDGSVDDAWQECTRMVEQNYRGTLENAEVLIVSHHPLINAMLQDRTGARTSDASFHHAKIAHVKDDQLHWFVGPKMVEREDRKALESAVSKLLEELESAELSL